MKAKKILALDLGTSSVGGAVVIDGKPKDCFVRIFPEGMDRSRGEKSLKQDRRNARSIRRQGYRRVRRKRNLEQELIAAGLLPEDFEKRQVILRHPNLNPYELRTRALDEPLQPYQFGRALYHLGQRRGYLSNRKAGSDTDGVVKEAISELSQRMQESGARTIGEFFFKIDGVDKIRGHYTARHMYLDEFELIWQSQADYSASLNNSHKQRIKDAIFYQRPLKIQKHLIGSCELEPERKRAYAASMIAQQFRLWQNIHNLRVQLQKGESVKLSLEQKQQTCELLASKKTVGWGSLKKKLGFLDGDVFNLESNKPSGMQGNVSAWIVANAIGSKPWNNLGLQKQEALINDLIHIENENTLLSRLKKNWRLTPDVAKQLAAKSLSLPKGTMRFSSKAMRRLLPLMEQGIDLHEAMKELDYLEQPQVNTQQFLPLPDFDLRNPLVQRALFQVRRVVNAAIKAYGSFDVVRIELARDLRHNAKQRAKIQKQIRQNENDNELARLFFADNAHLGISNPSRQDLLKHRLWLECGRECPFTQKPISAEQLFITGEVQVEHIIPYTRCLDDSYMNKTLCFSKENQRKGNATPYELYKGNEKQYAAVLQAIKSFPKRKRERFNKDTEQFMDDFVSQQLNETGYIARVTMDYLKLLGCRVEPIKGGVTANLRHAWGLNRLLHKSNNKNREDHRHHALDALVLAFTDRKAVKLISEHSKRAGDGRFKLADYPLPYNSFRDDFQQQLDNIVVSHKTCHKIKGALHEDTLYGAAEFDAEGNATAVAIRKPLAQLKPKDLELIRDERIRDLALRRLASFGSMAKAFNDPENPFGIPTKTGDVTPINSVRLLYRLNVKPIGTGARKRHVKTGSNHHAAIYKYTATNGAEKWRCDVVSVLDAKHRQKLCDPIVQPTDANGNNLVMSLHINDMLRMEHNGIFDYFRVQKMTQSGVITLRHHQDARTAKGPANGEISKSAESLRKSGAVAINVNVLGRVKDVKPNY